LILRSATHVTIGAPDKPLNDLVRQNSPGVARRDDEVAERATILVALQVPTAIQRRRQA